MRTILIKKEIILQLLHHTGVAEHRFKEIILLCISQGRKINAKY